MSGIGIALSAVSVAIAIGTSAASGAAANKSKKAAAEAERVAKKKVEEARREIQRMPMQELSLDLQGFKAEQEASQVAAAMAIEGEREKDRGNFGRIQMADIAQQRAARLDKATELQKLEILKATERQEASDKLANLSLAEAEGAQIAAAEYESQAADQTQAAITGGLQAVQGAANLAGSIAAPKMEAAAAFDQNLSGASEADLKQMLSTNPDAAAKLDIPNLDSAGIRKAYIKYMAKDRNMWTNPDYLSGVVTPASTRNLNPTNYE